MDNKKGRPFGSKNKTNLSEVMKMLAAIQKQLDRIEGANMDEFKVGGCD